MASKAYVTLIYIRSKDWLSLDLLNPEDLLVYESYIDGKWPRDLFIFKGLGTKECLRLVHTHVYEPFCVNIWKVWLCDHFINRYSIFGYIDRKSNAFDKFIEFKAKSNNLLGKHIKTLRLDQGNVFIMFILSYGVWDDILVVCTKEPIEQWSNGKKILNFERHSEVDDWFFITSHIL